MVRSPVIGSGMPASRWGRSGARGAERRSHACVRDDDLDFLERMRGPRVGTPARHRGRAGIASSRPSAWSDWSPTAICTTRGTPGPVPPFPRRYERRIVSVGGCGVRVRRACAARRKSAWVEFDERRPVRAACRATRRPGSSRCRSPRSGGRQHQRRLGVEVAVGTVEGLPFERRAAVRFPVARLYAVHVADHFVAGRPDRAGWRPADPAKLSEI